MHINTPILNQQIPHQYQPLVYHGDEGIRAFAPGVAVGNLFEDVGFLGEGVVANLDVHREIRADVEGRVDGHEFDAALFLNLLTQGAVLQGGEDQLVVPPDELVCPALELAAATVQREHIHLQRRLCGLLGARFVHLLDDLEGI